MSQFYSLITNYGEQLIAQAIANKTPLPLKTMAIGDGNGKATTPKPSQTTLIREVYRAEITDLLQDSQSKRQIIAELLVPETIGGFTVREIGLFDEQNKLVAIANCPENYKPVLEEGSGKVQYYRIILRVSSNDAVTLSINNNIIYATRVELNQLTDNLAAPDGFKYIGECESIAQLRTIEPTADQQRILVKSYYAGKNLGGGVFYADFGDSSSADNGWDVVVTQNGKCWKQVKFVEKSLKNKRIKLTLPLVFEGYESELLKNNLTDSSGYIYPGSFAIDEKANELVIVYGGSWANAPMYLVAVDFDTGEQKWWVKLNTTSIGEGISINYDYGSRKAFIAGRQDGFLSEFDLSNITSGATLDITASYNVGVYNQFSYDNGIWAFERNAPFIAGFIARNTIDFYDKNFNLLNSTSLPMWSSGYVTKATNDYAKYLHKRQGFALKGDKLYCAFGGAHDNNTPAVCTEYQGTKIFNLAGDCLEEAMLEPIAMRKILTKHLGKQSELRRIENEGIVVTSKGEIYTLYIYHSRATSFETRKKEGIVIFQELTDAGDCVDYSAALTYTAQPDFMSLRRMPRGTSGKMIDPLTGKEITQMSEIFKFLRELNISDVLFDTGGFTNITDIDGKLLKSGLLIRIVNQNTVMYVEITSRNHSTLHELPSSYAATLAADGKTWTKNKCDLSIGGDLVFGKDPDGKSTILARLSTRNYTKGKNILFADIQSSEANNSAFIGGGSSVYEGVNQLRFFTAANKGEVGTARWAILNNGHFIPWGNGVYEIGAKTNRLKRLYTQDISIAKDDSSQALIRIANALREITINVSAGGNAGIWDNNLAKWLLVAGDDGVLKAGTAPVITAIANELITAGWFKSQFSQSLSGNGWEKMPSGRIMQWGIFNAENGNTFNFPIAFNQVFNVYCTDENAGGDSVVAITVTNKTNTSFSIKSTGNTGRFAMWAIGR